MFGDLLRRLTAPEPEPLHDMDARLALAALLVRLAKADDDYAVEEIRRIDRIIASRYGLNPVDAAKLRADAEDLERDRVVVENGVENHLFGLIRHGILLSSPVGLCRR